MIQLSGHEIVAVLSWNRFLNTQRLTIVSSIWGPQRFSIEFPDRTVPVQRGAPHVGLGEPLFSFKIDEGRVITGSFDPPLGMLQRNERHIATIQPDLVPTAKRLAVRAKSVTLGKLIYASRVFPISYTRWLGLVGSDFVLRDSHGRRVAFWKRWNTKTRVLISGTVPPELCDAILGLALYTEIEKGIFC